MTIDKTVFFHVDPAVNPEFVDFDYDHDKDITTADLRTWAHRREYPDEYVEKFPAVMFKLFEIDTLSHKLKIQYAAFFKDRNCSASVWNKGLGDEDWVNKQFVEDSKPIRYRLFSTVAEMDALGKTASQFNTFVGSVLVFLGADQKEISDIEGEIRKAVFNEEKQLFRVEEAALATLHLTADGPATSGIGVYTENVVKIIKASKANGTDKIVNEALSRSPDKSDRAMAAENAEQEQNLAEHNYDERVIYGLAENGPAAKAGVKIGDRITSVNGKSAEKMAGFDIANELIGPCHSTVPLTVDRNGTALKFKIERADLGAPAAWFKHFSSLLPTAYPSEVFAK